MSETTNTAADRVEEEYNNGASPQEAVQKVVAESKSELDRIDLFKELTNRIENGQADQRPTAHN